MPLTVKQMVCSENKVNMHTEGNLTRPKWYHCVIEEKLTKWFLDLQTGENK